MDLVVYALIAALVLVAAGTTGGGAETLVLHTPGGGMSLDLSRDTLVAVEGRLGLVTVEIREGRARISASPCTGQHCVRTGWISEGAEVSVCLPSGVWMECVDSGGSPDAVTR